MTHDYKRNGVTTLFVALNVLTSKVLSITDQPHRYQEWLRFLKTINRHTPKTKQLQMIVNNYAPHKHPEVLAWPAKHPRFHMHFTPTSSSWLNMVERFFRDIADKRIRRGVFASVPELEAAMSTSPCTTPNPNRLSGPPRQATSWPKSLGPAPF